jgi:glutaredoxin
LPLRRARTFTVLIGVVLASAAFAQPPQTNIGAASERTAPRMLQLDLYVRGDSELCVRAQRVAEEFCKSRDGIELRVHDVGDNRLALDAYWKLVAKFHVQKPVLPAFFACQRLKMGFADNEGDSAVAEMFTVDAYVRPGCQHCRDARTFLTGLAGRWKGIQVVFHDVAADADERQAMMDAARRHGVSALSLPGIVVCDRYIAGYQTDATTGHDIEALLWNASTRRPPGNLQRGTGAEQESSARPPVSWPSRVEILPIGVGVMAVAAGAEDAGATQHPVAENDALPLPPEGSSDELVENYFTPPEQTKEVIDVPWFGRVSVRDLGLPLFTLAIGLIDGFNPCAMWVLVFLLSVLANVKDRRKIAAIAGTFVLVSGVVYFAFMAAWLNLFMLIDLVRPLQVAVGMLAVFIGVVNIKDFFAFKKGITLSIPESAKPGIYDRVRRIVATKFLSVAVGLSVVLALLVNAVELLCTAGLPALYTQILTQQNLPSWQNYAYLGLYNLGYIFDDSLMVGGFIITLSHRKMREDEGRWLKLLSGVVVLALGATVLFKPEWLQWGGP